MDIVFPFIGIPNYSWKKEVIKIAKKNPNEVELLLKKSMCYDCERHYEFLEFIDKGETNYKKTQYYLYQKNKRNF